MTATQVYTRDDRASKENREAGLRDEALVRTERNERAKRSDWRHEELKRQTDDG